MNLNAIPSNNSLVRKVAMILLALLGIAFILWMDDWLMNQAGMPNLTGNVNPGLLLLIGFLTSFHCVGMCGPLILGYAAKNAKTGHSPHTAHFLYGIGKTISYTAIGALFGGFGAIIAFTPYTQGAVGIAAGLFLMLFGLHMLEVFSALSHFQFKVPTIVMRFVGMEYRKHSNPLIIGLLNGLMIICGPLQAMYVLAAGSGSWAQGAAMLFFFGIGTLPLLLGFGFLTSVLSNNLTPKLLKASGVIMMALGLIMLNRGLAVIGDGFDFNSLMARGAQYLAPTQADSASCENEQNIYMEVLKHSFSPNKFTLRKGIPVKWAINAKELNECNSQIVVREYGLEIQLTPGLQVIEFTPTETGVVPWSCWMGMIPGTFIVVEDPASRPQDVYEEPLEESKPHELIKLLTEKWLKLVANFQHDVKPSPVSPTEQFNPISKNYR